MEITDINQLDLQATYSYADYLTWKFTETVELLRGKLVQMSAPKTNHQEIVGNLFNPFKNYLRGKPCKVYVAPFDVKLYDRKKSLVTDRDITTVVQPDVCVICDLKKIDNRGCNGSPDLIIEVVSASTKNRDLHDKKYLYAESGVLEYWIAFTDSKILLTHTLLENGTYSGAKVYSDTDFITPNILPELTIDLSEVFDYPESY